MIVRGINSILYLLFFFTEVDICVGGLSDNLAAISSPFARVNSPTPKYPSATIFAVGFLIIPVGILCVLCELCVFWG